MVFHFLRPEEKQEADGQPQQVVLEERLVVVELHMQENKVVVGREAVTALPFRLEPPV